MLISRECTLYLLSILYLPALERGSMATLFLYLLGAAQKTQQTNDITESRGRTEPGKVDGTQVNKPDLEGTERTDLR